MSIFGRKHKREVPLEEWQEAVKYGKHKHVRTTPLCPECNNDRICRTCMGAGCITCDYTGICVNCLTWKKEDGE